MVRQSEQLDRRLEFSGKISIPKQNTEFVTSFCYSFIIWCLCL